MKNLYLRSCVALLCAASLSACGCGSGSLLLGGTITGLSKTGLVLNNGSDELTVPANATTFVFGQLLDADASFNVQIKTQPSAAVCSVINGTGKASTFNVTSVFVACVTNSYTLGGTISGLTGAVQLTNGSDTVTLDVNGSTTFTFPTKVADGAPYGITVLTKPSDGKTCSAATGRMGAANITSVQITCA